MSQTVAAQMPAAVDYERTLVLAIEVSNKSWVLAAQVPGFPHTTIFLLQVSETCHDRLDRWLRQAVGELDESPATRLPCGSRRTALATPRRTG
jgi:hypothetical protein